MKDFIVNGLLGGIISGLIVTIATTMYFKHKERQQLTHFKQIAFNDFANIIHGHISMLQDIYKSSSVTITEKNSTQDYFFKNFSTVIKDFDFETRSPSQNELWFSHISRKINEYRKSLKFALSQYILYLEPNEVQLIKDLLTSNFDGILMTFEQTYIYDKQNNINRVYSCRTIEGYQEYLDSTLRNLKAFIDLYDKLANKNNKVLVFKQENLLYKNVSPNVGSSILSKEKISNIKSSAKIYVGDKPPF